MQVEPSNLGETKPWGPVIHSPNIIHTECGVNETTGKQLVYRITGPISRIALSTVNYQPISEATKPNDNRKVNGSARENVLF